MVFACVRCLRVNAIQSMDGYEARPSTYLGAIASSHPLVTGTEVPYEYEYSYVPNRT